MGGVMDLELKNLKYNGNYCYPITGVSLGRIRLHHQPDPASCLCLDLDEPVLKPDLRRLQHLLHPRIALLHADPLRRVSAG